MGKKLKVIVLLAIAALFIVKIANGKGDNVELKPKELEKSIKIQNKLKLHNKLPIKSIYSRDGDIIDCIDVHKQPAFDHPMLRNHTIQMKPSFNIESKMSSSEQNKSHGSIRFQVWQKSGSCPKGTIPIRRICKEDLLRTTSLHYFGKKTQGRSLLSPETHRSATVIRSTGSYIGASGDINVWNPSIDLPNDFSASLIWLKNGFPANFETVEAGWAVNPKLYGDRKTRFTIYWTVDGYKSTGCHDLTCSGFVQTNPKVALGAVIDPVSSKGGHQYQISIGIFRDPSSSNWWLKMQGVVVGYWPAKLFKHLKENATSVEWGGEVFSSNVHKTTPHTGTSMGSGHYGSDLLRYASYISNPRIIDMSTEVKFPQNYFVWEDEPLCYSLYIFRDESTIEPVFFYGGPGRNEDCP